MTQLCYKSSFLDIHPLSTWYGACDKRPITTFADCAFTSVSSDESKFLEDFIALSSDFTQRVSAKYVQIVKLFCQGRSYCVEGVNLCNFLPFASGTRSSREQMVVGERGGVSLLKDVGS